MGYYIFHLRALIFITTLGSLSGTNLSLAQDIQSGAQQTQDLTGGVGVFNTKPVNPPVYQRRKPPISPRPNRDSSDNKVDSSAANSTAQLTEKRKTEDMVEDAIALGNSARDSNPPRFEDAERAYKLAAKLESKDPRPYIGLGNILYDQKKHAEAAAAYMEALRLAKPDAVSEVGKMPRGMSGVKFKVAPPRPYQIFIQSNQDGQLNAYLGRALLQKGALAKAESEFRKAIIQSREKAGIYAQLGVSHSEKAEWYALRGYSLFLLKKYSEASESFKKAVELDPNNLEYKELLKRSSNKQKK